MLWLAVIGHTGYSGLPHPTVGNILRFIATGLRATYRAIGQLPGVGVLLAVEQGPGHAPFPGAYQRPISIAPAMVAFRPVIE